MLLREIDFTLEPKTLRGYWDKIREVMSEENNWCQGSWRQEEEGGEPCRVCLLGGMLLAQRRTGVSMSWYHRIRGALEQQLPFGYLGSYAFPLACYNDSVKGLGEIQALLEKTEKYLFSEDPDEC